MQISLRCIQISITDYFEYLPVGPHEAAWTFCISAVGRATIAPGATYPPPRHPVDHMFTWERGRTLAAFQLVAIESGRGQLELQGRSWSLSPGSVFLLPPGAWHRYRPDSNTGWTENWIELRGPAVEAWLAAGIFAATPLDMRGHLGFWNRFAELHALCQAHPQGYRAIAAGIGMTLVASTMALEDNAAEDAIVNQTVRKARELLLNGSDVASAAKTLGFSYPTFYRHFKKATGLTPKEYARELRLAQAEDLLSGSNFSIKEIAARLGYYSASHFSSEFRRFRKVSPAAWPGRVKPAVPILNDADPGFRQG